MSCGWNSLCRKFVRKKTLNKDEKDRGLKKTLSTLDLTLLGVGSSIGLGMYVLAGVVAKTSAGPAVIVSFLIAAFASILAGLCFAEFGARVPNAGSAYAYSYVSVGELIAFIVGWNLIIEYAIGVASIARAYSAVFDTLIDHSMIKQFKTCCSLKVSFFAEYFDGFAFLVAECVAVLLTFGVKESVIFNNIFTGLNMAVVIFVIFTGSAFASTANWKIDKDAVLFENNETISAEQVGHGGFAPFGFHGIMKGSATCFYGFVGFDSISASAEEAKNPQRSVPLAIIFSLSIVFLAYFGTATVLTMMVPYYLQDSEAPLAEAFSKVGYPVGKWIVTIGALCGHSASLLDAMFPMPRVIYAMADDGVLFKFLAKIHSRFKTPAIATMISGTFGGLMAAFFELGELIDMMSIGTLTAYTIVAVCVICLRYGVPKMNENSGSKGVSMQPISIAFKDFLGQSFNKEKSMEPTPLSSLYVNVAVFIFCLSSVLFNSFLIFGTDGLAQKNNWVLGTTIFLSFIVILMLISLSKQPISSEELYFKVPLVPWIPGLSILFNIYLMLTLQWTTWVRFGIWMIIGFVIYGICLFNGITDDAYRRSSISKHCSNKNENMMEIGELGDKTAPILSSNSTSAIAIEPVSFDLDVTL